ncbi:MAG: hypothetical protein SOR95_07065 [Sutterella sp.]|nr:hypothetical protein [Sutterella sp.]
MLHKATRAQDDRYRQLARDIRELDRDIRDAGAASAALHSVRSAPAHAVYGGDGGLPW